MGQILLDVSDRVRMQVLPECDLILDLEYPPTLGRGACDLSDKRKLKIVQDIVMMKMIVEPGPRMREFQQPQCLEWTSSTRFVGNRISFLVYEIICNLPRSLDEIPSGEQGLIPPDCIT